MNTKLFFLLLIFIHGFAAYGQTKLKKDTATVNALIAESRTLAASDSAKAIHLATQAREIASEIKYRKGEANALKYIGMVYYGKGMYGETLDYWSQSLKVFESAGDDIGISNMLKNNGAIYLNQAADDKALEWFRLARHLGGEEPRAWDWQSSCIVGLAKICLKQNKTEQAKDTLHYAAVTLDIPEACWLYATTLSEDDANRPSWLKKAAISGIPAAARELAHVESRRLNDRSLSKGEMVEKQALADEWLGIAGDKALY